MRRLLVAIASLLATLLLLESVARLVLEPPRYVWIYPFDGELGFRAFAKDSEPFRDEHGAFDQTWNSRGYRGPEYPTTFDDGIERILFLGDSFVQGYGVRDERLAHDVVERKLDETGRAVRCYTASGDGYGTVQEVLLLRRIREEVRPDRVVLLFFSGNDVINNAPSLAGRTNASAGDYVRPYFEWDGGATRTTYLHPARAFWRRHSRLFGRVEARLFHNGFLRPVEGPVLRDPEERLAGGLLPAKRLELFLDDLHPEWQLAWSSTQLALTSLVAELGETPLLLVVIPEVAQVQWTAGLMEMDEQLRANGQPALREQLNLGLPEGNIFGGNPTRIDHLFGVSPLRAAVRDGGRSVYQSDGHLNGRGQECLGEAIADHLLEREAVSYVSGPVDLVAATLERGVVDFHADPREEVVLSGLEPAIVEVDGARVGAQRMKGDWARFATPGRAGVLCLAGVVRGASPDVRGLSLDNEVHPLAAEGSFWITSYQKSSEPMAIRSLGRAEGDVWLTGYALLPANAFLSEPARVRHAELAALSGPAFETRAAELLRDLPERAGRLLEDVSASLASRLEGLGAIRDQLEALSARATSADVEAEPILDQARKLVSQLREHAMPLVAEGHAELDDEGLLAWATFLGDTATLRLAASRLQAQGGIELARVRDRLAVAEGRLQPYGTLGVDTPEGRFGPPTVEASELAANRRSLDL